MALFALLLMLVAFPAAAVTGDLNRDGVVNYDDFFIFADNFGKTGAVQPLDTVLVTVLDTVMVIESVDGLDLMPRTSGYQDFPELGLRGKIDWRPIKFGENDRLEMSYIVEWQNLSTADIEVDYELLWRDQFGFAPASSQGFYLRQNERTIPAGETLVHRFVWLSAFETVEEYARVTSAEIDVVEY